MTVASPPPPPGTPAPKKGMGPLGWIAIGCGAIALVVVLLFAVGGYIFKKKVVDPALENPTMAAAETLVRLNPDLELISSDPAKNTLTVKNKKTGEVVTINAESIQEDGKITFETAEGKTEIDTSGADESGSIKVSGPDGAEVTWGGEAPKDLPDWVPVYSGATVQGAMDATDAEGRSASFSLTTDDSVDDVISFYETELNGAGLKVTKNLMESDGQRSGLLSGTSEDEKRSVTVIIGQQEGKTQATVSFQDKK